MTTSSLRRVSRPIATLLLALAVVTAAACRERRPPPPELPPLGPGPIADIPVPGATAIEPVIASRPPLVAIAFSTRDSRGPRIYLATSDNNGATFTEPQPLDGADPASRYDGLRISFASSEAPAEGLQPALRLEWRSPDGRILSQTAKPWSRAAAAAAVVASEAEKSLAAPATTITSCSTSGEASLLGADGVPVPINHSVSEEACVPGEIVAVADSRRWVHAVWIGRTREAADPRVFYASSSHGNGFGFSQVLADNRPKPSHLRVATDPNETVVTVWDQEGDAQKEVWLRQLIPSHLGPATLLPLTRLSGAAGGQSPALASIRGGVIAAWVVPGSGSLAVRRVGLDALCAEPPSMAAESSAVLAPSVNETAVRTKERE